jgi:hypothetical protein
MLDLFTSPDDWAGARAKIDVFKFYSGQVGSEGWSCDQNPAAVCGDNYLENFVTVDAFSKIEQWGLDLAIESFFAGPVMAVDPIECSTPTHVQNFTLNGSINVIQSVEDNGGVVKYLAMDEPLRQWLPAYFYIYTGQSDPRPCLVDSIGVIADYVAAYISQMQVWFPSIPIGHIELYPEVGVEQYKEWVIALEARGVSIPFLHLDVNGPRLDQYNSWGMNIDFGADLLELKTFLEPRGIELGVIFTDIYCNSQLWEPDTYDDETYYDATLDWLNAVDSTGVEIDHRIFQSWVKPYFTTGEGPREVPINLPEDDLAVHSHTRLINEAFGIVVAVEEQGNTPAATRLDQNAPNPFNPATMIRFDLPQPGRVLLTVYDMSGRLVRTLAHGPYEAGVYRVPWDGRNEAGRAVASGVYFYQLDAPGRTESKKMVLLK